MRVICADCKQESDEKDMDADCRYSSHDDHEEEWSNHICPNCGFWNDTYAVWRAEANGIEIVDLSKLYNL